MMATVNYHQQVYSHNKKFLSQINTTEFPDWTITVCFYCSLHKMCACMHYVYNANDNELDTHGKAKDYIKQHNLVLAQIYGQLYKLSRLSRYECINVSGRVAEAKSLLTQIDGLCDRLMRQKAQQLTKS